jgi:excisionase family DNA binding protein
MIDDLATHARPFVTVREIARYWLVTDQTVRNWVAGGALRAVRVGRVLRIPTNEVRRFHARCNVAPDVRASGVRRTFGK